MSQVYFAALKEKHLEQTAISAIEAIHYRAGQKNYVRLNTAAQRTDTARNVLVGAFMQMATDPNDVLVMLDYDHDHPIDIIDRLTAYNKSIVGALAFRRGEPYFPCVFFRHPDGTLRHPERWEPKLYRVDAMGTAAIAIRRYVFDELKAKGVGEPWFRYVYPEGSPVHPSEDMYFSHCCEMVGIPMYCDMGLITDHLTAGRINQHSWFSWLANNPNAFTDKTIAEAYPERVVENDTAPASV